MRMLCMSGAMAAAEFGYSAVGLYFDSMHGIFWSLLKLEYGEHFDSSPACESQCNPFAMNKRNFSFIFFCQIHDNIEKKINFKNHTVPK